MKKIKIIIIVILSPFLMFSSQKTLAVSQISIPDNFSQLPKQQKIMILKYLITQVSERIQELLAQKKSFENLTYIDYRDERGGDFIIKYPSTWKKTVYKDKNVFDFKVEPIKDGSNRLVIISTDKNKIQNTDGEKEITKEVLEKKSQNVISFFKVRFGAVEVIYNKAIVRNGKIGREIFLSYYDDLLGNKVYVKQLVVVDSKNMILVDIECIAKDKKRVEPIFKKMIESFKTTN